MVAGSPATSLAAAAAAAVFVLAVGMLQRRAARRRAFDAMARLCERLPKCELHAHLHGSARLSTIAELAPAGVNTSCLQPIRGTDRSLESCFAIFGAIHQTVTSVAAVRRITLEVLADFAADGVKYLELRTTPRALSDADAAGYVDCVLAAFAEFEQRQRADAVPWPLVPRLILSVDRTGSREAALATARLAVACAKQGRYVVGLDFSGNPTRGSFTDALPAFEEARREGLGTAVHVAEVEDKADTDAVLAFRPDRLGHALTLTPAHIETLRSRPMSIEICPTSNMKTLRVRDAARSLHGPKLTPCCGCCELLPLRLLRSLRSHGHHYGLTPMLLLAAQEPGGAPHATRVARGGLSDLDQHRRLDGLRGAPPLLLTVTSATTITTATAVPTVTAVTVVTAGAAITAGTAVAHHLDEPSGRALRTRLRGSPRPAPSCTDLRLPRLTPTCSTLHRPPPPASCTTWPRPLASPPKRSWPS